MLGICVAFVAAASPHSPKCLLQINKYGFVAKSRCAQRADGRPDVESHDTERNGFGSCTCATSAIILLMMA